MRRRVLGALCIGFILTVAWAHAQPTDPLARSDMALVRAWEQTPLTVRHATFVTDRPIGFGMYTKRPNDIFKPGEKLVVYAEPVGYGWKDAGNGMVEFGLAADFVIRKPNGEILDSKQNFARKVELSHAQNREFMLTLTLDVNDAPPGDYILEYKLHDVTGSKSTSFDLPFRIQA